MSLKGLWSLRGSRTSDGPFDVTLENRLVKEVRLMLTRGH